MASHKREPDAESEKELAQVVEQAAFQIVGVVAEGEKIEVVGIFGYVPREVGLRRGQSAIEVGNASPCLCSRPDSIW